MGQGPLFGGVVGEGPKDGGKHGQGHKQGRYLVYLGVIANDLQVNRAKGGDI